MISRRCNVEYSRKPATVMCPITRSAATSRPTALPLPDLVAVGGHLNSQFSGLDVDHQHLRGRGDCKSSNDGCWTEFIWHRCVHLGAVTSVGSLSYIGIRALPSRILIF